MRPSFTTGTCPPKVSTTAICSSTRKVSRMTFAVKSEKLSAQSPPCSTKASPARRRPSFFFSARASPAKTSGGYLDKLRFHRVQRLRVGIIRHLDARAVAPG
jgi:hypothetical protein